MSDEPTPYTRDFSGRNERGSVPRDEFLEAITKKQRITIRNATIDGDISLQYVEYPHVLDIQDTTFAGHLDLREARFGRGVCLSGCTFERNIDLSGARIGGRLSLRTATIRDGRADPQPAEFSQIRVDGTVSAPGLKSEVPIHFDSARIEGAFSCRSVEASRTTLAKGVRLFDARVKGTVNVNGADIRGGLDLRDAVVEGDVRLEVVDGHRCEIRGGVNPDGTTTPGVNLDGTRVTGSLTCRGAWVANGLTADGASVHGNVEWLAQAGHRVEIEGGVSLWNVIVSGGMHLTGIWVRGDLDIRQCQVGRNLLILPQAGHRPFIDGELRGSGMHCRQTVQIEAARITGPLMMQLARADQGLFLTVPQPDTATTGPDAPAPGTATPAQAKKAGVQLEVGGEVDLQGCNVLVLDLDGRLCGQHPVKLCGGQVVSFQLHEQVPAKIDLQGFQYRELELPEGVTHLDLLRKSDPFHQSNYVTMEKWLRDRGQREAADRVYREMRRRMWDPPHPLKPDSPTPRPARSVLTRLGESLLRPLEWLLIDLGTGYGTASGRLIWVFLLLVVLSTLLFIPREAVTWQTPGREPEPGYTRLQAFWLALQTTFPVLKLASADGWKPSEQPLPISRAVGAGFSYRDYASAIAVLSWILGPIFVASITGYIKREK